MQNKDFYVKNLNECADDKFKIEEGAKSNFRQLKKMFKLVTKTDGKVFKTLSDLDFFRVDVSEENKMPKLFEMFGAIGMIFSYYKLLGNDSKINNYLKETFGVEIKEISEGSIEQKLNTQIEKDEELEKKWSRYVLTGDLLPNNAKDFIKILLKEALNLRVQIEQVESKIKDDISPKVEEVCKTKKSNFMKTVGLKVKEHKNGKDKVIEEVKKIQEESIDFNDAIKTALE
jgi:hypothetical protein